MQKLIFCQRVNANNALVLVLFCVSCFSADYAVADVYKCTSVDQVTQKSKIIYTDTPCEKSAKQKTVDVADPVKAPNQKATTANLNTEEDGNMNNDSLFNRAILDRDFKKAKTLATTKEQWRLIALAEDKSDKSNVLSSSDAANQQVIPQSTSQNDGCEQARNDYDVTSRNQWRERDLVAAKKSIMLAACGKAEAPSQPYVVNNIPYNGIRSYSTPIYPYGYGWGQHYPYGDHHNHDGSGYTGQASGGQTSGGSVTLRYNSKNFGVRAESFGVKSQSFGTQTFGTQTTTTDPH